MSPQTLSAPLLRKVPLLATRDPTGEAVGRIVEAGVPALPVVDDSGRLAGIFGEREFIGAVFPGYLGQLSYAHFVTREIDDQLDRRAESLEEPVRTYMNTEHIDVGPDFSDAELAETFLHHRVLIVPVTHGGEVEGIVTRSEFFVALAERFAARERA